MNGGEISSLNRSFLLGLLDDGRRSDGRTLEESRPLTMSTNVVSTAEASVEINLGNTLAIAGLKVSKGAPYPDRPSEGVLNVNIELCPMASPDFELGPLKPDAIELSRTIERGLHDANVIDLNGLCIEEGEMVWVVYIDIYALNFDGNLQDAGFLACLKLLSEIEGRQDEVFGEGSSNIIDLSARPISVTMLKIDEHILMDPSDEEESTGSARMTVTVDSEDNVRTVHKSKGGQFDGDDVIRCVRMAKVVAQQRRDQMF